jgi:hypothetical protein
MLFVMHFTFFNYVYDIFKHVNKIYHFEICKFCMSYYQFSYKKQIQKTYYLTEVTR